jgi:hypothetical protein
VDQIEQLTDKVLENKMHIFEINKKNQKIGNSWSSCKATDQKLLFGFIPILIQKYFKWRIV